MTNPNSAAREWDIKYFNGCNAADGPTPELSEVVHVIEFSAYEKQQKIIEVLREGLSKYVDVCSEFNNNVGIFSAKLAIAEADRIKETE
jgi:hypothetical protein